MQRFQNDVAELGDREIGATVCTPQVARDGHILEPAGVDVRNYLKNPVILRNHNVDQPVAMCSALGLDVHKQLAARIQFPPLGASKLADETLALVKAGVLSATSISFRAIDMVPLDPKKPWDGQHILQSELLEISIVSVPADTGAMITERAFRRSAAHAAAFRLLPPVSDTAMRRAAAAVRIVEAHRHQDSADLSFEARQAEAERLIRIGKRYPAVETLRRAECGSASSDGRPRRGNTNWRCH